MVFDAIYRFYVLSGNQEIGGHKNQLKGLCKHFEVPYDKNELKKSMTCGIRCFTRLYGMGQRLGFSMVTNTQP
jgi:hypothetical protein